MFLSGPEEGALSPVTSSHTEEQVVQGITTTTTSLIQQMGGGGATGERRRRREGETKPRSGRGGGSGLGPPDLDLDQVEKEAREEERRNQEAKEAEEAIWRRKEKRSQTVRPKRRGDHGEQGRRSRSFPRNEAQLNPLLPEGGQSEKRRSEAKSRRRVREDEERKEGGDSTSSHAKHPGSSAAGQKAAFSFLMPRGDQRESDSESEVSLSAASIATTGWREEPPRPQGDAPGPWLKPSPQRLTQVLIGSQLGRRELVGGLSL